METTNAKIESTSLGFEDHGILTYTLVLDYGGSVQGFGGYALGGEYTDKTIRGILETLGVTSWEKLEGTPVRVVHEGGLNGKIQKIGHLLEDKWFNPSTL